MQIHCPHCHNPIELVDGGAAEILCTACGSTFRLEEERTPTYVGDDIRVGKFRLLEKVGTGAFGVVWKAHDTELDRRVAVKIPHAGRLASDLETQRFLREARAAAQLKHPSIVSIHDAGQNDGTCYLVSELVEGATLADRLAAGRLSFRAAAELIVQVADALDYAHQQGVIHRDLKPSNIMLDLQGRPHVMDFGLAKREAGEITVTLDGQVLGTPAYMSPEQARGEAHDVDARSDVYSLGVILYELLTGELPFRGNKRMLIVQVLQDEPRAPRTLNDQIPRDLETICLKAMSKTPARRYASAHEMADDLRRWIRREPIRARPVGAVGRLWRWGRRKPAIASLLAALALVIMIGFVAVTWQWVRVEAARDAEVAAKGEATRRLKQARAVVDTLLTGVSEGLVNIPGAQEVRQALLEEAARIYSEIAEEESTDPELQAESGWALIRLSHVRRTLGDLDGAERNLHAAEFLFKVLLKALRDQHDWRHGLAQSRVGLGLILTARGRTQEAENCYRHAIDDYRRLVKALPSVAAYREGLAGALANLADIREAEAGEYLRDAALEFESLATAHQNDSSYRSALATTYSMLGQWLSKMGRYVDALSAYRKAFAQRQILVESDPTIVRYRIDLAKSRIELGDALRILGPAKEAETHYRKAIDACLLAIDEEGSLPDYRIELAVARSHLGNVLRFLGENAEAEKVLNVALEDFAWLLAKHPDVAYYREGRTASRALLSQVLRDLGRNEQAETVCKQAITEYEALLMEHPESPVYKDGKAICLINLGQILHKMSRNPEAVNALSEAIKGLRELVVTYAHTPRYQDALAWGWTHLGELYWATDQPGEAGKAFHSALELRTGLAKEFVQHPAHQHQLAWFLATCPDLNLRDFAEAAAKARKAVEIAPRSEAYRSGLGVALYGAHEWQASIAAFEEAMELRGAGTSLEWFFLAMAHWELGNGELSFEEYRKAKEWMAKNKPDDPELMRFRARAAALLSVGEEETRP